MRFSANEYYALANADCISVAKSLGMQVDERKQTTTKAVHIKHSGGLYIFPEKNNWYRHSDSRGGFPIDLVMDTLSCSKEYALEFIQKNVPVSYTPTFPSRASDFRLPVQTSPERVRAYLTKTRGIDEEIVDCLIADSLIGEDNAHHNCMFIGKDSSGAVRSCALRGTGATQFRGEVSGGDKSCSFAITGSSDKLRVFESPIDAMSHATFSKLLGIDWKSDHRLSANGCGHTSVLRYLKEHREISSVILSLDNDQAGRTAAGTIEQKLNAEFTERKISVSRVISQRKDWNEDLMAFRAAEKSGVSVIEFLKAAYPQIERSNYSFQQYKEG